MKAKRCLITGASGFVGANLARRLIGEGHETHVIFTARASGLAHSRRSRPRSRCTRSTSPAGTKSGEAVDVIRPDWVFHLAAYGAYAAQTGFARMVDINLMGCVSLLDACAEVGVEAFIYTGSSSEYGYKDHPPREDEVLEPNSHYAHHQSGGDPLLSVCSPEYGRQCGGGTAVFDLWSL